MGCTAQMSNSVPIWAIRCHVIAIRQSSAQLSIMKSCLNNLEFIFLKREINEALKEEK